MSQLKKIFSLTTYECNGDLYIINPDREYFVMTLCNGCFIFNPIRTNRLFGPEYDNQGSHIKHFLYLFLELISYSDTFVPEYAIRLIGSCLRKPVYE